MAKTNRDSFKFMLRLPDDLRDHLKDAAEESGRSVTAEILERLEASFVSVSTEELAALKRSLSESERVREIQAQLIETLEAQKSDIAKNARLSEELALQLVVPIQLAAEGNTTSLERLIKRAQQDPNSTKRLIDLLSPPSDDVRSALADLRQAIKEVNR